jgi:ribose 5-phosphate isomerase RpiB
MRICVITENPSIGAAASNYLSRSGHTVIIGENEGSDARSLLSEVKSNLRSSDMIIVLSASAKSIAISANKLDGVNAVACKDHEDAIDAISSTEANVIVVDSNTDRRMLTSILDGLTSGAKPEKRAERPERAAEAPRARERERAQVQAPKAGPGLFSGIRDAASNATSGIKDAAGSVKSGITKPSGAVKGANETISSIKSKGLMKHLKDTFGIED